MFFKSEFSQAVACPFCRRIAGEPECTHMVGWTEDGRTIQPRVGHEGRRLTVGDGDRVVKTGVSARIYREVME